MQVQTWVEERSEFFIHSRDFEPAYMRLYRSGELQRRAREAVAGLAHCLACPRNCGVDRLADKTAACKTGRYARVSSHFPHFGEEDCLRGWNGSGTIFFSMCNLRCVFCLHPDTSIATDRGMIRIADIFEQGADETEWHGGRARFFKGNVWVITREGRQAPVAKAFRHPFRGDLIRLKPFNCPPLLLTPNHEVFAVPRSEPDRIVKIRAECLTKDHYLIVPKRTPAGKKIELDVCDLLASEPQRFRKSSMRRIPVAELEPLFEQPLTSYELAGITGYHPAYLRKLRGQWHRDLLPIDDDGQGAENELVQAYFLIPLHKIERVPYDGPVFNLEIDDPDHSYLAPFVAVSNCQNYDISQAGHGEEAKPERIANMMLELQARGCHNINFVTPEHVVPQVLEALPLAIASGLRLPIVYNTSAYDSLESLRYMDGIVDIYMPDFKIWDTRTALKYLLAKDYPEAARRAIREMHRQVGELKLDEQGLAKRGLLVRHLVMPGDIAGTREIMEFLAREVSPHTYVNVMAQYYPAGRVTAEKFGEINRHITGAEHAQAMAAAREAGLYRFDERRMRVRWN